jgi:hypothetical protein
LVVAHPAFSQEHPPGHGGDEMLPPGAWTDAEKAALHDLIAFTERELPAFADHTKLTQLGYHDFGGAVPAEPEDGGGSYYHYMNNEFINDEHMLDPRRPETLVFQLNEDGWRLVSAMFIARPDLTTETLPPDLIWLPGWHSHPDVCVTDDYRLGGLTDPDDPHCFSGRPWTHPPMTHVWIIDNSCEHRFAGIEVGGIDCSDHGHGRPGGMPTTTTTSTPTTSTTRPAVATPPVATPVSGNPDFTG